MRSTAARMREEFYAIRQPELDRMKDFVNTVILKERPPYNADEEQEVERYQRNIQSLILHI